MENQSDPKRKASDLRCFVAKCAVVVHVRRAKTRPTWTAGAHDRGYSRALSLTGYVVLKAQLDP